MQEQEPAVNRLRAGLAACVDDRAVSVLAHVRDLVPDPEVLLAFQRLPPTGNQLAVGDIIGRSSTATRHHQHRQQAAEAEQVSENLENLHVNSLLHVLCYSRCRLSTACFTNLGNLGGRGQVCRVAVDGSQDDQRSDCEFLGVAENHHALEQDREAPGLPLALAPLGCPFRQRGRAEQQGSDDQHSEPGVLLHFFVCEPVAGNGKEPCRSSRQQLTDRLLALGVEDLLLAGLLGVGHFTTCVVLQCLYYAGTGSYCRPLLHLFGREDFCPDVGIHGITAR